MSEAFDHNVYGRMMSRGGIVGNTKAVKTDFTVTLQVLTQHDKEPHLTSLQHLQNMSNTTANKNVTDNWHHFQIPDGRQTCVYVIQFHTVRMLQFPSMVLLLPQFYLY